MTPAIDDLHAAGIPFAVHEFERGGDRRDFGREAAERLDIDPDRVFKTLVVMADGVPAVAVVPVSCMLGLKALARSLAAKRVELCDPADAERITGYVRGGISPFGQRRRLPTVLDETATLFETIFVSGGKRGVDIAVAPTDLADHLGATIADIVA